MKILMVPKVSNPVIVTFRCLCCLRTFRSRNFFVPSYDKNVDDGLRSSLVPDDVIEPHVEKFWAPHPQTGVFGPAEEIDGGNQTQPPPPNANADADAADGSVLDQKARFRPLEDVEKLDVDKPITTLEWALRIQGSITGYWSLSFFIQLQ